MTTPAVSPPAAPAAPAAGPGVGRPGASLLEAVLAATHDARARDLDSLDAFLGEPSPWQALAWWLRRSGMGNARPTRRQVARLLVRDIAYLDQLLNRQVNAILHHPAYQALEASWRGLRYLVDQAEEAENVKVKVLQLSWRELAKDIDRALEFDQSQLFRKVYTDEFGAPGGEPYGILLGDYALRPRPGPGHPTDDIATLTAVAAVAAAAFAPFIAGAHPALLDLEGFWELERPHDLARTFTQIEYVKWRALRDAEDSRFVGLTLPHVLVRLPYDDTHPPRADGFPFREEVGAPDRSQYLWGNAVFALGAVVVRAFGDYGWFADIRGVRPGAAGQGLVDGLPVHQFTTDKAGVAPKCSTDVMLSEYQEKELAELGFIPLSHCPGTERTAFFSNQSIQKPKPFDREAATVNARLAAMLQYVLCVSRFAHYLKVMARDKVGSFNEPSACEDYLQHWLLSYITANSDASLETKAKHPLYAARVEVKEYPGKPGSFQCLMHLQPHMQLDQALASIRLTTEMSSGRRR